MPKPTRLQREMSQFDDESYKTEFSDVIHIAEHVVKVTMPDNSVWTVIRSEDFMEPPTIYKNGEPVENTFCLEHWSPALTSVKALLMVYALIPE